MHVKDFYKGHWTDYPLDLQGVLKHLEELYPEGVKGKRVIDGGSGSGMVSVAFAILGAEVTGVDVTPECIANGQRRAERHNVKVRFLERDLVTLDLGDEKFDIVYSWGVLHHTPDAEASFHSLAKHLKPGGDIVIAVYLKTFMSGFWNFSRVFYQNSPGFLQATFRTVVSGFLNCYDWVRKTLTGRQRYMMRGTDNQEILNDWFGVPHRTFHSYDEVHGWFEKDGLEHYLINPATGRFKSTSNFVIRNRSGNIGG
jgi:2-polyprenyl-6-hydroxyphenyl methylase/3-demethylubiquinone-9 3-methyltransferase